VWGRKSRQKSEHRRSFAVVASELDGFTAGPDKLLTDWNLHSIHPSAVPGLRIIHVSCLMSYWWNCQICKLIRLLAMTVARHRQGKPRKRCTYLMAGREMHIYLIHNHTYSNMTQSTQGRIEIDQSIGIRVYHFSVSSQNRAIGQGTCHLITSPELP
jgi:hypothetical protein